jgi:hypothetical protein
MEHNALILNLQDLRVKIKAAQNESTKQYLGVDTYLEKALQNIDLALCNLGVPISNVEAEG